MTPVLVINSGSSSFKYQLVDVATERPLASGLVERIGEESGIATHTVFLGGEGAAVTATKATSRIERAISPLTVHIGFKSDLDLPAFLAQAELRPESIEKVNVPKIWSLVSCIK